jgi:hypothetical protein
MEDALKVGDKVQYIDVHPLRGQVGEVVNFVIAMRQGDPTKFVWIWYPQLGPKVTADGKVNRLSMRRFSIDNIQRAHATTPTVKTAERSAKTKGEL